MSVGRALLIVATAGAAALVVRSIVVGPVPLAAAIIAMSLYVAIAAVGAACPCLNVYAEVACRGSRRVPEVALTFDGGPHPIHTAEAMDLLDAAGVKATFFVSGAKAEAYPEVTKAIVARGHDIGIRGHVVDPYLGCRSTSRIAEDLERAVNTIVSITNTRPATVRPPTIWTNGRVEAVANRLGLAIVGCSVRGRDDSWRACPSRVAARVRRGLRPGAIVQLHDDFDNVHDSIRKNGRPAGVDALPSIVDAVFSQGLRCVHVIKFVQSL